MACAPDPVPGGPLRDDPIMADLAAAVTGAKGSDPLAPVTVVAPSAYAALFARRALGALPGARGRRGIANVNCTTVDKVTRQLGAPVLAAQGLRLAPGPVDLEAIRVRALEWRGWLADLVGHPRGLVALRDALGELRRCPAPTLVALGRRRGRIGDLANLLDGVRAHLHGRGFADTVDLAEAAAVAAQGSAASVRALGPVVCLDPGPMAPSQRRVLDLVMAAGPGFVVAGPEARALTEVRQCADPDEEVRAAVRAVVASVEAGVPAWSQAILHPPGSPYARALHQEIDAAGVAANGPDTRRLDRSVAGATLLGLLDLARSDWGRDDVVAWISTAPVVAGRDGRRVPASRWDELSATAGVVRGAGQWTERLRNLAVWEPSCAPESEALAAFVERLVASAADPGGSWSSHAAWAVELIDRYLVVDPESWPAEQIAATEQVRGTVLALAELDSVSDRPDRAAFAAPRAALEETGLDGSDLPDGGFGDGVFVAPFGRARGLRFEGVVLVGLADAIVPGGIGEDALLSEEDRRLDTSGGLRTRATRIEELHGDLVAAAGAGATRRTATYPRVDTRTGREQVPSRWMTSIAGVATRRRSVDSFAASVATADPPLSLRELELHDLARWAADGRDPALSPVALDADRLPVGLRAARDRAGADFTRFDGNVGVGLVSPFLADAPMSATRLEAYAKCPRRFLYDRVLQVSKRTLPEELWQMEPIARGSLVHAILEAYLLERIAGAPRSLPRLQALAEVHFAEAEGRGLGGKALLWRMDKAAMRRDLARFYDEEGDLEPLAAELEFGTGAEGADPPVVVVLDSGDEVRFKGMADRVDRARSGDLVVSDYKTGKQRMLSDLKKDPVAGGRLLQLPIYAMAARARFGGDTVRARYWLLSESRVAPSYSVTITDAVEARFRDVLALIAGAVDAGAFPGAPTDKGDRQFEVCRNCDFDGVCPSTRDRQWARKSGAPDLAPVLALMNAEVPDDLEGAVVDGFGDDAGVVG